MLLLAYTYQQSAYFCEICKTLADKLQNVPYEQVVNDILGMCEEYSEHTNICKIVVRQVFGTIHDEDQFREAVRGVCALVCG